MKYQRVLYTSEFTDELKKKLRILRYDKRKSLKGNVYYVGFSSEADAQYATKLANKLPNVTMKPFQRKTTKIPSPKQSASRFSSSPEFSSLPSTLTYLPENWYCVRSCSQPDTSARTGETLLERGQRLLGLRFEAQPTPSADFVTSKPIVRLVERNISPTDNLKRVLVEEIKSCLAAIDCTRQAADDFCRFNELGHNRNIKLQRLFQLHSTAHYWKAAISAQLKMAANTNLRLPWSATVHTVDGLKAAIVHEQLLKEKTGLASDINSKINLEASIALSAKLIYQLSRISIQSSACNSFFSKM